MFRSQSRGLTSSSLEQYGLRERIELDRIDRSLSLTTGSTGIRIRHQALVEEEVVVQAADIAKTALHMVAGVSMIEAGLAQLVPHAGGRLSFIADSHARGMAMLVTDCPNRLRS